jgi:probable rRNA maturation factor
MAERMLCELGLERAELSVLVTNDAGICELNRVHRKQDRPTDVLAFPLDARAAAKPSARVHSREPERLLGDVVISLDTAARQAASRKRPLEAEVTFLLAHGLAHLVGHDHKTKAQKQRMDRVVRRLVRSASAAP